MSVVSLKRLIFPVILLLLAANASLAQDGSRGPVHTEPPQDDSGYLLMGEFVGPVTVGENEYETVGLQIRPLGKDEFEAIAFSGGLPGQQKHRGEAKRMIGKQADGFLVLSGGPWAIFAEQDHCLLLSRSGERVGRLERIERRSPTLGAKPPADAMVLFDGSDTDQFKGGNMTDDGLLMEGADIKPMFQDFDLHLEFRLPYMPEARDQGRGNSGIYIQSRYECQILDSFGQEPAFNGAGSLYRFKAPQLNMALPPLVWQTYDIRFTAPRWASDGEKIRNARITVWLNGVIVQDDVELEDKTGAGQPEAPLLLPTKLQNHRDPVRFRNIWVVDRGLSPSAEFPVEGSDQQDDSSKVEVTTQPDQDQPSKKASKPAKESEPKSDNKPNADKPTADKQDDPKRGEEQPDTPSDSEPSGDN